MGRDRVRVETTKKSRFQNCPNNSSSPPSLKRAAQTEIRKKKSTEANHFMLWITYIIGKLLLFWETK